MSVSVIIPTFNRAAFLRRALQSVQNQTRQADEVIVVDDGSTDDTAAVVAEWTNVICRFQENSGVAAARNRGAQIATGEWLAFLDSDDQWQPQKLQRQCAALADHPDAVICYTAETWERNGQIITVPKTRQKFGGWIFETSLQRCVIGASSVMLRTSVFEACGGFDTDYPACEDYELWLRLTRHYPVLLVNEPLVIKRAGDWPQLSDERGLDRYRIRALVKLLNRENDTDYRRRIMAALADKIDIYRKGCQKHGRHAELAWLDKVAACYL